MGSMKDSIEKVLFDEESIEKIVKRLGEQISRDYEGKKLLLVSVLKGSVVFMADLMRSITVPCEIDFMVVSSYGAGTRSSGNVKIVKDLGIDVKDYDLLIVEESEFHPLMHTARQTGAPCRGYNCRLLRCRGAG